MIMVVETTGGQSIRGALIRQAGQVVTFIPTEVRYGAGEWFPSEGSAEVKSVLESGYGYSTTLVEV